MINENRVKIAGVYDEYHKDPRDKISIKEIKKLELLSNKLSVMLKCAKELYDNGEVMDLKVNFKDLNTVAKSGIEAAKEILKKRLDEYFTDRENKDFETVKYYIENRWNATLYRRNGKDWFAEIFQEMDYEYDKAVDSLEGIINDISAFSRMSEIYVDQIKNKY